ncbi:TIGR00266 family protein [uncultured Umboniibacter sp.]|uniref:TIGR00266 family protein n=1 Tax=uncultured Umboniibacter sp. TaxID=1798917 RepID=UPI00262509C3|nr:TIGR00266 family protein [uncultured Umboniibacter sp.]
MTTTATKQCDELDYQVNGNDLQVVEITLDPGETVIAEAGAMNFLEDGIEFSARMGDGSVPDQGFFGGLMSAGKRLMTGESFFITHFINESPQRRTVAFSAPFPGSIIALNLAEHNYKILCQKDAFLCASRGTRIGVAFTKKLGAGFFGGEGFILQSLQGDDVVCLHAGGTVTKRRLNGETIHVDSGCIVAFSQGIDYDVRMIGGLKTMMFGGEGIALATLSGTGDVWLQSLPFARLADRIYTAISAQVDSHVRKASK